jgi:hypothetical protein
MGLIANMFHPAPGRKQWFTICADICSGLANVRTAWFDSCVAAIEFGLLADGARDLRVTNRALVDEADHAITAYQLCVASEAVASNSYVRLASRPEFNSMLQRRACGHNHSQIPAYVTRYASMQGDRSTQHFRLGRDVAGYILGADAPMLLCLQIAATGNILALHTEIMVAGCFGDTRAAGKAQQELARALS